jgi:hypothetical protein
VASSQNHKREFDKQFNQAVATPFNSTESKSTVHLTMASLGFVAPPFSFIGTKGSNHGEFCVYKQVQSAPPDLSSL